MAVGALPVFSIERIGDAPPQPLAAAPRPLGGVRVLDLTRIIAGPVCGRTLAAHGADVLLVTAPHLPAIEPLVIDTGRGKLSCRIDLRDPVGQSTLRALLRDTDVFVQGYHPGALRSLGFGPEEVARLRPGIVYVSLSAYSHVGPWAGRRGFDSLVQTASGFNEAEAQAAGTDKPDRAGPSNRSRCGLLDVLRRHDCTHSPLYRGRQLAYKGVARTNGKMAAPARSIKDGLSSGETGFSGVQDLVEERDSGFGRLTAIRHAAQLSRPQRAGSVLRCLLGPILPHGRNENWRVNKRRCYVGGSHEIHYCPCRAPCRRLRNAVSGRSNNEQRQNW